MVKAITHAWCIQSSCSAYPEAVNVLPLSARRGKVSFRVPGNERRRALACAFIGHDGSLPESGDLADERAQPIRVQE